MPQICNIIAHNKQCWPHADPLTALGADITAHEFLKGSHSDHCRSVQMASEWL